MAGLNKNMQKIKSIVQVAGGIAVAYLQEKQVSQAQQDFFFEKFKDEVG